MNIGSRLELFVDDYLIEKMKGVTLKLHHPIPREVALVPTGPGEMSLYYMEHYRHPTVRIRRATLRTDGFVSVNAPYAGGSSLRSRLRSRARPWC